MIHVNYVIHKENTTQENTTDISIGDEGAVSVCIVDPFYDNIIVTSVAICDTTVVGEAIMNTTGIHNDIALSSELLLLLLVLLLGTTELINGFLTGLLFMVQISKVVCTGDLHTTFITCLGFTPSVS